MKLVCIKNIRVWDYPNPDVIIKKGEIVNIRHDTSSGLYYVNDIKRGQYGISDIYQDCLSMQDYRNYRILMLTKSFKANKRLKNKITKAFDAGDVKGAIRWLKKIENKI